MMRFFPGMGMFSGMEEEPMEMDMDPEEALAIMEAMGNINF